MRTHQEAITAAADVLAETLIAIVDSDDGGSVSSDGNVSSSRGPIHEDTIRDYVRRYREAVDYPRRRPVVTRYLRDSDMLADLDAADAHSDVEEAMVERSLPERDA